MAGRGKIPLHGVLSPAGGSVPPPAGEPGLGGSAPSGGATPGRDPAAPAAPKPGRCSLPAPGLPLLRGTGDEARGEERLAERCFGTALELGIAPTPVPRQRRAPPGATGPVRRSRARHEFLWVSPAGASVCSRAPRQARSLRWLGVFTAWRDRSFCRTWKRLQAEVRQNPVFAFLVKLSLPRQGKPYHFRFSAVPLPASKTMRIWRDAALGF